MDPNTQNSGSFMANAGGFGPEIMEAMQRRKTTGQSPLTQQSPQAPSFQPSPQSPQGMPQGGMPASMPAQGGMQPPKSEANLIVSALTSRLKDLPTF